jgi:hypothetical protein
LWLFASCGYDIVIGNLVEGLAWTCAGWGEWRVPATGSLTKARARLSDRPLERLFRRSPARSANPRNRTKADTPARSVGHSGRVGRLRTRALIDAGFKGCHTGEQDLAHALAGSMTAAAASANTEQVALDEKTAQGTVARYSPWVRRMVTDAVSVKLVGQR